MYSLEVKEINAIFRTIISKSDALEYFTNCNREYVSYDYETASENPKHATIYDRAYIMGTSFCYDPKEAVYIPFRHREDNAEPDTIELTKEFIRDTPLSAFNMPFEYAFTKYHLGFIPKIYNDSQVLSSIYDSNVPKSLKECIKYLFNYSMQTFEEVTDNTKDFNKVAVKNAFFYGGSDSLWNTRMLDLILPKIEQDPGLSSILRLENSITPIICEMHYNGVHIDRDVLFSYQPLLTKSVETIKSDLVSEIEKQAPQFVQPGLYGNVLQLNLNAPGDVQRLFAAIGIDLSQKGTGVKVIKEIDNPIAKKVIAYRQESKILSTYIDAYIDMIGSGDLIYPSIVQLGAPTGRMAGRSPNLMAVPKIRD